MIIVKPHTHLEAELLKWIVMLTIAAAMTLFVVSAASGAPTPPSTAQTPSPTLYEQSVAVWEAIELLREDYEPSEAVRAWRAVKLPRNAEVWRHVAIAAAQLRDHDWDEAAKSLDHAMRLQPENAVVHYYNGILQLAQSKLTTSPHARVYPHVTLHAKSMHEFAAMWEFEMALGTSPHLDKDQLLVPVDWAAPRPSELVHSMPIVSARVHDLLKTLGEKDYQDKARQILDRMYCDHGLLKRAPQAISSNNSYSPK